MIFSNEITPITSLYDTLEHKDVQEFKKEMNSRVPSMEKLWTQLTDTEVTFPITLDIDKSKNYLTANAFIVYRFAVRRQLNPATRLGLLIVLKEDTMTAEPFLISREAEDALQQDVVKIAVDECTSLTHLIELVEVMIL